MRKSSWKFFVGIGVLLVISGVYVYPIDDIIGLIGILSGIYNIYKGIQLRRGKQPYLIRKQKEALEKREEELEKKLNESQNKKKK